METPSPPGVRRIVASRLLFASRKIWISDGRFSGSGEADERVPVDKGEDPVFTSAATRPDARTQHILGLFSTVASASRWKTHTEDRF